MGRCLPRASGSHSAVPYPVLYFRKLYFPGSLALWLLDGVNQSEALNGECGGREMQDLSPLPVCPASLCSLGVASLAPAERASQWPHFLQWPRGSSLCLVTSTFRGLSLRTLSLPPALGRGQFPTMAQSASHCLFCHLHN